MKEQPRLEDKASYVPLRRGKQDFDSTHGSVYSLTRSHDRKLKKLANSQLITLGTKDYNNTMQSPSMGDVRDIQDADVVDEYDEIAAEQSQDTEVNNAEI